MTRDNYLDKNISDNSYENDAGNTCNNQRGSMKKIKKKRSIDSLMCALSILPQVKLPCSPINRNGSRKLEKESQYSRSSKRSKSLSDFRKANNLRILNISGGQNYSESSFDTPRGISHKSSLENSHSPSPIRNTSTFNLSQLETPVEGLKTPVTPKNNKINRRRSSSFRNWFNKKFSSNSDLNHGSDTDETNHSNGKKLLNNNNPINRELEKELRGLILEEQPDSIQLSVSRHLGRGAYGFCYEVSVTCVPTNESEFMCTCNCHEQGKANNCPIKRKFTIYKALKILSKNLVEEKFSLIEREVTLQGRMLHENVLRLYGGFHEPSSGTICLLMDLCPLGSLNDVMTRHNNTENDQEDENNEQENDKTKSGQKKMYHLPEAIICRIFVGLVKALDYIHQEHKVVHRDVKPANVMLRQDYTAQLSDFGLSCTLSQCKTNKDTICGTPNYLAPEVFLKQGHSFESDFWSLGCTLYYALCGQSPFNISETTTVDLNEDEKLLGTENAHVKNKAASNATSRALILRRIYRQVIAGKYRFPPDLNQSTRRLIKDLLKREPSERLTSSEIMQTTFCKNYRNYLSNTKVSCCQCTDDQNGFSLPNREPDEALLRKFNTRVNLNGKSKRNSMTSSCDFSSDESSIASVAYTGSTSLLDTLGIITTRCLNKRTKYTRKHFCWISRWALTADLVMYYTLADYDLTTAKITQQNNEELDMNLMNNRRPLSANTPDAHLLMAKKRFTHYVKSSTESHGAIDTNSRSLMIMPDKTIVVCNLDQDTSGSDEPTDGKLTTESVKRHCEYLLQRLRRFHPNLELVLNSVKNMINSGDSSSPECDSSSDPEKLEPPIFVQKWILINEEAIFLFSDGSWQINFRNHAKLIGVGEFYLYSNGQSKAELQIKSQVIFDLPAWVRTQPKEIERAMISLMTPLI